MLVYKYACASCGYSSVHAIGTSDMDQTLTDVNNDYASYRLFSCPVESKFLSANVLSPNFVKKCPADGSSLVDVPNVVNPSCPRCGEKLKVEKSKPLSVATNRSME